MYRAGWLFVPVLFLSVAFAEQSHRVVKDPTAMAIARRSLAAMGGTNLANFQNVQVVGTTTIQGERDTVSYPITLMGMGKAGVRSAIHKSDHTDIHVSDGSSSCVNGAVPRNIADSSFGVLGRRIDFVPALSLLREYANADVNLQYVGRQTVSGLAVDVIALTLQPPSPPGLLSGAFNPLKASQRLYSIDRASGMVIKMQYVTVTDASSTGGLRTEVFFSNYRSVGGFAVPFRQTTYADGSLALTLALQSAVFNVNVAPDSFALKCEVPRGK